MSKSYHKSNTLQYAFLNFVCYVSNKKCKKTCNRIFRAKSKNKLIKALFNNDLDNYSGLHKTREAYNNWNFDSDGMRRCFIFKHSRHPWTLDEIKKCMRK